MGESVVARIFQPHTLTPDRLSPTRDAVRTARLTPDAPVFYDNQVAGTCYALRFYPQEASLWLWFRWNSPLEPDWEQMTLVCGLDIQALQCVECESCFTRGDVPCRCIFQANCLVLRKFSINFAHLCENSQDRLNGQRQILLDAFFGGGAASLQWEDLLDE